MNQIKNYRPLLSIIVPVYNQENYLQECIDSLTQENRSDIEIILIDDGSTDESLIICQEAEKKNDNIRVLHQDNCGLIETRRRGILSATGKYVVNVDSDDYLLPGAINELVSVIDANYPDMIFFNATRSPNFDVPLYSYKFYDRQEFHDEQLIDLKLLMCAGSSLNNLCFKCIKRDVIDADTIYKNIQKIRNGEDLYQCLPILDKCRSAVFIEKILYYYRPNASSMTKRYNGTFFDSEVVVNKRRLEYAILWSNEAINIVEPAEMRIHQIFSVVQRSLLTSELPWKEKKKELVRFRKEPFYIEYYLSKESSKNNYFDKLLKNNNYVLLRLYSILYGIMHKIKILKG